MSWQPAGSKQKGSWKSRSFCTASLHAAYSHHRTEDSCPQTYPHECLSPCRYHLTVKPTSLVTAHYRSSSDVTRNWVACPRTWTGWLWHTFISSLVGETILHISLGTAMKRQEPDDNDIDKIVTINQAITNPIPQHLEANIGPPLVSLCIAQCSATTPRRLRLQAHSALLRSDIIMDQGHYTGHV